MSHYQQPTTESKLSQQDVPQAPAYNYQQQQQQPVAQQPGQGIDINRYLPQKEMTIRQGGNRNSKNLPADATGRDWSNGLFECCNDPGTCVVSCCCPCITYGQNRARMDSLNDNGQVLQNPEPVNNDCLVFGVVACFTGIGGLALELFNRQTIRHRYGVRGDIVMDALTLWCCGPCAMTQESQEIALEEQSLLGGAQQHHQ